MVEVEWHPAVVAVIAGIVGLGALGVALGVPLQMMRHIQEYRHAAFVGVGVLAVAGLVALLGWWSGYGLVRRVRLGGAAVLAVGAAIGFVWDGLSRTASSIPTSVGGLLVAVAVVAALLYFRSR